MIRNLLAVGAALVLAELTMSLVLFRWRFGATYYTLRKKYRVYRSDSALGYRHSPNLRYQKVQQTFPNAPRKKEYVDVVTDKFGFFFEEDIDQLSRNGARFVFCVGGSTTAGTESRRDLTYPAQLDALLRPEGFRCVNTGLGGGRSIHELLLIEKVLLRYKPSAIVIFSGYNDYESFAYEVFEPGNPHVHYLSASLPRNALERIFDHSSIYHFIRGKLTKTSSVAAGDLVRFEQAVVSRIWLDEWKANIRRAINLCHATGTKCFLLETMSPVYEGATDAAKAYANTDLGMNGRFDQWLAYLRIIDEATQDLCSETGATFVSVRPAFEKPLSGLEGEAYFRKRYEYFLDRAHFSELANGLLAQSVFEHLQRELI